jgi:hypothetical protein
MQQPLAQVPATRSALVAQLRNHVTHQLRQLQARRSAIPALLGFAHTTNPAKCLRRFDAVCQGDLRDSDLIERIIGSPLGGAILAEVFSQLRHLDTVDRQEKMLLQERRDRENFVPHIHAVHERRIPEHPFFVIAFLGIDHFKRVDLPSSILQMTDTSAQLLAVWDLMDHICTSEEYQRITGGPFGRATRLLYRDAYDHAYVYDVESRAVISDYNGVPRVGTATITFHGRTL